MSNPFYRAFEDRFRGSRELIKQRLRPYLLDLHPLAQRQPGLVVLDLGCGRGEWLELLQEQHIPAIGIDQDPDMLAGCQELGLTAVQGDAIALLQNQPDATLLAVSGFHIAEHLPFEQLQTLFAHARRALAPGGMLILETPNPENLLVGAANFYIDPTHQRPLPAALLQFLAEHHGFVQVQTIGMQAPERLTQQSASEQTIELYDVLGNVSPDYAVIAWCPPAPEAAMHPGPTAAQHAATLHSLARRYDAQQQNTAQIARQATATAQLALATAQQAVARAEQMQAELTAIQNSTSWRITRPLRWLGRKLRPPG